MKADRSAESVNQEMLEALKAIPEINPHFPDMTENEFERQVLAFIQWKRKAEAAISNAQAQVDRGGDEDSVDCEHDCPEFDCPQCRGTGLAVEGWDCEFCDGTGELEL